MNEQELNIEKKVSFIKKNGIWEQENIFLPHAREYLDDFLKKAAYKIKHCKIKEKLSIWRYKTQDKCDESRSSGNYDLECDDYSEAFGNLMLNEGAKVTIDALIGTAFTAYSNANARLLVGNSNAAAADTQTALQGGSTGFRSMESTFPKASGSGNDTFEAESIFGASDSNFAWEEYSVDNGSSPLVNLNRFVTSQGTKASPQIWTLNMKLQFT